MERSKGREKELYPKNKLKAARVSMGLKQVDLAEMVGLSYQTYCLKEQGKMDLWLSEANALLAIIKEHDSNATLDAIFTFN